VGATLHAIILERMNKTVITDWGQPILMVDADGHDAGSIPRYGVWMWLARKARHECVDTGDDLEALRAQYGPDLEVVSIKPR
jgi:hypothetical protein